MSGESSMRQEELSELLDWLSSPSADTCSRSTCSSISSSPTSCPESPAVHDGTVVKMDKKVSLSGSSSSASSSSVMSGPSSLEHDSTSFQRGSAQSPTLQPLLPSAFTPLVSIPQPHSPQTPLPPSSSAVSPFNSCVVSPTTPNAPITNTSGTEISGEGSGEEVPFSARYLTDKAVLLTYFCKATVEEVNDHFVRALGGLPAAVMGQDSTCSNISGTSSQKGSPVCTNTQPPFWQDIDDCCLYGHQQQVLSPGTAYLRTSYQGDPRSCHRSDYLSPPPSYQAPDMAPLTPSYSQTYSSAMCSPSGREVFEREGCRTPGWNGNNRSGVAQGVFGTGECRTPRWSGNNAGCVAPASHVSHTPSDFSLSPHQSPMTAGVAPTSGQSPTAFTFTNIPTSVIARHSNSTSSPGHEAFGRDGIRTQSWGFNNYSDVLHTADQAPSTFDVPSTPMSAPVCPSNGSISLHSAGHQHSPHDAQKLPQSPGFHSFASGGTLVHYSPPLPQSPSLVTTDASSATPLEGERPFFKLAPTPGGRR